jgi:hypothetical protein
MITPNQNLRNTAIYVGNDEQLRKRAIEYYESNGYEFKDGEGLPYVGEWINNLCTDFIHSDVKKNNITIITLPEPEPKSEYPCLMLVTDNGEEWNKYQVICEHEGLFIAWTGSYSYTAFNFAKPIPTTTITTEELIEFYEKNNNVKVKLV